MKSCHLMRHSPIQEHVLEQISTVLQTCLSAQLNELFRENDFVATECVRNRTQNIDNATMTERILLGEADAQN